MALPTFTKLGAKLTKPAWLSSGPYFPRIFENDLHRGSLVGLPAERFSVLFSTDHAVSTGSIGRADFDDIEATWTDSGAAVHTGADQRETPFPVYDPVNNRVNVYVHDDVSTVTHGSQNSRLLTTANLSSFTDQGEIFTYGHHTGYGTFERVGANDWRALHGLVGTTNDSVWIASTSESADGVTWTRGQTVQAKFAHLMPAGYQATVPMTWFTYQGQEYLLTSKRNEATGKNEELIAIPVAAGGVSPVGGYYTLLAAGTGTDPDASNIRNGQIVDVDGTLYLIYNGTDSLSAQTVCVAKQAAGEASQTTPNWPPQANGDLQRGNTETIVLNWDAINDPLPAEFTKVAEGGVDGSAHVPGSYYELKAGPNPGPDDSIVHIRTADLFIPSEHESIECEWTLHSQDLAPEADRIIQVGLVDSWTNTDGLYATWHSGSVGFEYGLMREWLNHVAVVTEATRSIGFVSSSGTVSEWCRNNRFSLKLRVHDFGNRASLFLDDQCCWHRDIEPDGITFGAGAFFGIRLFSRDANPEVIARIEQVTVRSFASGGHQNMLLTGVG